MKKNKRKIRDLKRKSFARDLIHADEIKELKKGVQNLISMNAVTVHNLKTSQAQCKKLAEERDSYIKEIATYKDFEGKITFPLIAEKIIARDTENIALKQQIINQNKRIEKMRDLAYKSKLMSETIIDESLPF